MSNITSVLYDRDDKYDYHKCIKYDKCIERSKNNNNSSYDSKCSWSIDCCAKDYNPDNDAKYDRCIHFKKY